MKKIILVLLISIAFLPVLSVVAEGPPAIITDKNQIITLLNSIVQFVWAVLGVVVIIMLLYAGFMFVTAAGNDDNIKKAKDMVKYSLIGIVVMFLSGGIMRLIESFLAS